MHIPVRQPVWHKHRGLKWKALLWLLLFTLIPILLMGVFGSTLSRKLIREKTDSLMGSSVEKLARYISWDMQYVFETAANLTKEPAFLSILQQGQVETESSLFRSWKKFMRSSMEKNRLDTLMSYAVVTADGLVYTSASEGVYVGAQELYAGLQREQWFQQLSRRAYNDYALCFSPNLVLQNGEAQAYFACNIISGSSNRGVLLLGVNQSYFTKMMETYRYSPNAWFALCDTDSGQPTALSGGTWVPDNGEDMLYFRYPVADGYTQVRNELEMRVPLSDIYWEVEVVGWVMAGLGMFALISAAVLISLLNRWMIRPVVSLSGLMNEVRNGNLTVRAPETQRDEIGMLQSGFNIMIAELQQSIGRIHREEEEKRLLEIRILQEQINPHFIRNTLNTIRWMAELKQAMGISRAITSFIRLMDYSFREPQMTVTLEAELSYLNEYIYLQRLRYQNKFSFEAHLSNEILTARIPRLLLQPIIENSIVHGLAGKQGFGALTLEAEREEAFLVIRICDDGLGIPLWRLSELSCESVNRKDAPAGVAGQHIGLANVKERIRRCYGEQFTLAMESEEGRGTRVILRLPFEADVVKEAEGEESIEGTAD